MKKSNNIKNLIVSNPVTAIFLAVSLVMCVVTMFFKLYIGLIELAIVLIITVVAFVSKNLEFRRLHGTVMALQRKISAEENGELSTFPLPILLVDSTDKIVWYNKYFLNSFLAGNQITSLDAKQFTSGQGVEIIRSEAFIESVYGDKEYTVYSGSTEYKNEIVYALYFVEDTALKKIRTDYVNTRPVVMIISLDGAEDSLRDFRESQQGEILGGVETIVEDWFAGFNCVSRKGGNGKFFVIADAGSLEKMREDKFSILSRVRSYTYNEKVLGLTLSIGVGIGNSLTECEAIARKSLDMAMGRGGDQVAIKKVNEDFEFFGGVSKGVEKRTKVRTRMVASAIGEIITASSNVLVMGHRFADLDALGSATGVAMIARALGKDARIVMSSKTTLAMPLAKHLMNSGIDNLLIEPEDVDEYLSGNTVLVIVDTHRKSFLEYPELFDLVGSVIVIDHHRKTVDHINKAVIFYHEPNASSASEMVTELIEYMPIDINVPPACAEALMSGITLDTKNFVMKTGVRTFEAAAYLRSLGADTVAVKQLFSNSMKTQKAKSEVVKNAAMYKNCAIGVVDFKSDDIRIVASQAADELLNVDGVMASFVLFKTGDVVNISARSYGDINVQLVMEELDGGGHQTMAAAQLAGETFEGALKKLSVAIDVVNGKR